MQKKTAQNLKMPKDWQELEAGIFAILARSSREIMLFAVRQFYFNKVQKHKKRVSNKSKV